MLLRLINGAGWRKVDGGLKMLIELIYIWLVASFQSFLKVKFEQNCPIFAFTLKQSLLYFIQTWKTRWSWVCSNRDFDFYRDRGVPSRFISPMAVTQIFFEANVPVSFFSNSNFAGFFFKSRTTKSVWKSSALASTRPTSSPSAPWWTTTSASSARPDSSAWRKPTSGGFKSFHSFVPPLNIFSPSVSVSNIFLFSRKYNFETFHSIEFLSCRGGCLTRKVSFKVGLIFPNLCLGLFWRIRCCQQKAA